MRALRELHVPFDPSQHGGSDTILQMQLQKKSGNTCPLPYPEKFKAAVKLVKDREAEG